MLSCLGIDYSKEEKMTGLLHVQRSPFGGFSEREFKLWVFNCSIDQDSVINFSLKPYNARHYIGFFR